MSDSVWPHRWQPTRLPIPGILQAGTLERVAISFPSAWKWKVKAKSLSRVHSYWPHGLYPTRLLHPWDFPDKSTGVGCHCLLQFGIPITKHTHTHTQLRKYTIIIVDLSVSFQLCFSFSFLKFCCQGHSNLGFFLENCPFYCYFTFFLISND